MAEPQVNPNALGAPAEGFGQTVSFAFDPRGEPPAQRVINSQGPRQSVDGTREAQLTNPNQRIEPVPMDPTAALLLKAGDKILKAKLDEQRTEQFVQGMQRAMAGEGIQEVKDSVPWYAKLFGDTPAIEGARAYTAQDRVNRTVADQAGNMHKLAGLSADEAGKHFVSVMNGALTGDAATDGVIMKQMTEAMPTLMKAQAKANVAYVQKKAVSALTASVLSGAAALQNFGESHANDTVDDKGMAVLRDQFVRSAVPPDGIDEENWQKGMTQSLMQMAQSGQFHAVEALRSSGVTSALTAEQGTRVDKAVEQAAAKARNIYANNFAREIAEIKSDALHPAEGQTPKQIAARIDQADKAFRKLTGSPIGLFTSDEKADMIAGTFNAIKAEEVRAMRRQEVLSDRATTATDKAAALAEQQAKLEEYVSNGDVLTAKMATKATDDEIHLEVFNQVSKSKDGGAFVLSQNFVKSSYVNPIISQRMQQELRLAVGHNAPTDGWFAALDQYGKMKTQPGGTAYAAAYFGDFAPKLEKGLRMLGGKPLGAEPGLAARVFNGTINGSLERPARLDDKELAKVTKTIASKTSGILPKWMGGYGLRPDALNTLTQLAREGIEDWRGTEMSDTEAASQGIAQALTSGKVELLGGFAIDNGDYVKGGKKPTPLRELMQAGDGTGKMVAIPVDKHDEYFKGFIHDQVKVPEDVGSTRFIRQGNGTWAVSFRDKDDKMGIAVFDNSQLQTYAAARALKDTTKSATGPMAFGPKITYRDDPDTVSVYASAAKKAAFKAEQDRKTLINQANSQPGR